MLAKDSHGQAAGMSSNELADHLGVPMSRVQKILRVMHAKGQLSVARVGRLAIDGIHRTVPLYSCKDLGR